MSNLLFQSQKQLYNYNCNLSICLSITKPPQPLRIKPICHYAYLLISQIPIIHHRNQPPCRHHYANQPPCRHHYANQQLCLSSIIAISHHGNQPLRHSVTISQFVYYINTKYLYFQFVTDIVYACSYLFSFNIFLTSTLGNLLFSCLDRHS